MAELFLELFQEEIPARMQGAAAEDLKRLVLNGLAEAGLTPGTARCFVTPRRLALVIDGLATGTAHTVEELKGPRVNAPAAALDGFLKKTGLAKDQLSVVTDPKGDFYVARMEKPGRATTEVIPAVVTSAMRGFPWPKSMRWEASGLNWVRPLRGLICLFDGKIVPFEIAGVRTGNTTRGHRLMANEAFVVSGFADYETKLRAHKVLLDPAERKDEILKQAKRRAAEAGLVFRNDDELLDEVAGLVEWPVVLTGSFDKAFLDVPGEVLVTTMRKNQKYFALYDLDLKLASSFLVVANLEARDGGAAIVAGNERVLRARLSDAKFFWEQDRRETLESRLPRLKDIVFHAKLGTQLDRVNRIEALAGEIAVKIGADVAKARLAARLCKADLVSGTVGEFPEVQGVLGGYLARAEGLDPEVADAIRDHYKPVGAQDDPPNAPVTIAVALADKLDTLTGFFAIDEKPTGSKDPFALRRAALGVVRILIGSAIRLRLTEVLGAHDSREALLAFFNDRLRVALRDKGHRHDVVEAVTSLRSQDDLFLVTRGVEALSGFLGTEDGAALLAGYKRAANILRIEEKKDKRSFDGSVDPELLEAPEEKALYTAIATANDLIAAEIERERFEAAMGVLANLRAPVDAFFEKVTVNAPDPKLRENRLALLNALKTAAHLVADFSKIEG